MPRVEFDGADRKAKACNVRGGDEVFKKKRKTGSGRWYLGLLLRPMSSLGHGFRMCRHGDPIELEAQCQCELIKGSDMLKHEQRFIL